MTANGVVAIVPALDPGDGFTDRLEMLCHQVDAVIVVDDGSLPALLLDPIGKGIPVEVVRQANQGIAAAINAGIRRARSSYPWCRFILTVDQDTALAPDYVERSLRAHEAATSVGIVFAATATARHNEKPAAVDGHVEDFATALAVAQSGMLFSLDALERIGLFDASLVIDTVETDWVLRALSLGEPVLLAEGTDMAHPVGRPVPVRLGPWSIRIGGRVRSFSEHSALRRYYITRNRLLVYPRFLSTAPVWLVKDTAAEFRTLVLSLVFGSSRRRQLLATVFGIIDGLAGRRGKASASRAAALIERGARR